MSSPRTHNHVHLWPDACTHISRHLSLLYFGSLSSGPHCTKTNSHIRAIVIVIVLKMSTLNAVVKGSSLEIACVYSFCYVCCAIAILSDCYVLAGR